MNPKGSQRHYALGILKGRALKQGNLHNLVINLISIPRGEPWFVFWYMENGEISKKEKKVDEK